MLNYSYLLQTVCGFPAFILRFNRICLDESSESGFIDKIFIISAFNFEQIFQV